MSLQGVSQNDSVQHSSHVRLIEYVLHLSMDCYSKLAIGDPIRLVKEGRLKIATMIKSGIETSNENR